MRDLAGVTNRDVAASATAAMSRTTVTTLRQGNQQIPVIGRLRARERAQLSDVARRQRDCKSSTAANLC
jgi:multidrug efflux pump subunit AcrB